jgi:glycosyltransferase involved in cell wall biosynthesis
MEPIVSICIPVYNGAQWLRGCIESAQKCSLSCEILIVDDCSTDESISLVKSIAENDTRIRVYVNEHNLGLTGNWNRCLELAKGKWIKFLFQDDRLGEEAIEKMVEAAGDTFVFVAAYRNYVFGDNSSAESVAYYTNQVRTLDKLQPGLTHFTKELIAEMAVSYPATNFIGEPSTVMFQRKLVAEHGRFETSLKQICDLEYWHRIGTNYGLCYVPNARVDFYVHDASVSAQNAGGKKYVSTYLDPVRLADEMVNGDSYTSFRNSIPSASIKRLKFWLQLRAYEARKAVAQVEDKRELEKVFTERPHLRWLSGKFTNPFWHMILKLKRALK